MFYNSQANIKNMSFIIRALGFLGPGSSEGNARAWNINMNMHVNLNTYMNMNMHLIMYMHMDMNRPEANYENKLKCSQAKSFHRSVFFVNHIYIYLYIHICIYIYISNMIQINMGMDYIIMFNNMIRIHIIF